MLILQGRLNLVRLVGRTVQCDRLACRKCNHHLDRNATGTQHVFLDCPYYEVERRAAWRAAVGTMKGNNCYPRLEKTIQNGEKWKLLITQNYDIIMTLLPPTWRENGKLTEREAECLIDSPCSADAMNSYRLRMKGISFDVVSSMRIHLPKERWEAFKGSIAMWLGEDWGWMVSDTYIEYVKATQANMRNDMLVSMLTADPISFSRLEQLRTSPSSPHLSPLIEPRGGMTYNMWVLVLVAHLIRNIFTPEVGLALNRGTHPGGRAARGD